jgi:molybdate transport system substrate-binding protein
MAVSRRGAATNALIAGLATLAVLGGLVFLLTHTSGVVDEPGQDKLVIYCAAGMKKPVQETLDEYRREYGGNITIDFGGSGTLLSRLQAAKSGDLYIAADKSYIDIAREKGLVAEALPVGTQKPVIAIKKGNPKGIKSIDDLLTGGVKFAIANPEAASIGKLTKKILQKTKKWDAVRDKAKVTQPTVNELVNSLLLDTVDAAIVWDALVRQHADKLDMVELPEFDAAVQQTHIAVLKTCKHPAAALRFCRYLQAPNKGGKSFQRYGYGSVHGDPWAEKPTILFFSGGVNRVAIDQTVREFEKREGVTVNVEYNGCGILVAQMKAGTHPDAYFACDSSFMKQLPELFPSARVVSETDMIIAVKKGNPKGIKSVKDLAAPGLKIGVANAKQSALGALTVNMLKQMKQYEPVYKNVSSQTPTADLLVNQLRAGSLDAVIVYRANVSKVLDKLDVIDIKNKHAMAEQPIAVSAETKYPYLTQRLVDAIESPLSKQRFLLAKFRWRLSPK